MASIDKLLVGQAEGTIKVGAGSDYYAIGTYIKLSIH